MARIDNYEQVIEYVQNNPRITGADLARKMGLSERTARRYAAQYRPEVVPKKTIVRRKRSCPIERNSTIVFDIETTDFRTDGYYGKLLCCSFLDIATDEVETVSLEFDDSGDDFEVLKEVAKKLSEYRFHIGHNIATFDYGWLNSRLMHHGLEPLDVALYLDTYQAAKALALKTSKGLGNLIDYFGLDGVKTAIQRTSWSGAMSQKQDEFESAMKNIVEHCELDVMANRELYNELHWYAIKNGRMCPWKVTKFSGSYWYYV
jgi:uncharacterized protein YprB with RNaseH-like and TPR domain